MVERGNLGKYKDGVGIEMVNLVFTQIDVLKKLKWKNKKYEKCQRRKRKLDSIRRARVSVTLSETYVGNCKAPQAKELKPWGGLGNFLPLPRTTRITSGKQQKWQGFCHHK